MCKKERQSGKNIFFCYFHWKKNKKILLNEDHSKANYCHIWAVPNVTIGEVPTYIYSYIGEKEMYNSF